MSRFVVVPNAYRTGESYVCIDVPHERFIATRSVTEMNLSHALALRLAVVLDDVANEIYVPGASTKDILGHMIDHMKRIHGNL